MPEWLPELASRAGTMGARPVQPAGQRRPGLGGAALVRRDRREADLLIVQRSPDLRRHAGQPAFPGGTIEASDGGPVGAALREAGEEVGVDPEGVEVVAVLPELFIARSGFRVTPVLAWWRTPSPVAASDGESSPRSGSVSELADPANRLTVRLPTGITAAPRSA